MSSNRLPTGVEVKVRGLPSMISVNRRTSTYLSNPLAMTWFLTGALQSSPSLHQLILLLREHVSRPFGGMPRRSTQAIRRWTQIKALSSSAWWITIATSWM